MNTALTPEMIEEMLARIDELSAEELGELTLELDALDRHERGQRCQQDFLAFCTQVYPGFKEGAHHRHIAPMLHDMVIDDPAYWEGSEMPPYAKRLTVSMPPRFGKSATIAFLYVAWYLGHNPTHQIMMVTHTASLSEGFGRQIRDLIDSPVYQEIFPETKVSKDKSAAGDWTTTLGGKYLAVGVGANVAGHGAHLLIADDLVSEQAVLANPDTAFETAWTYMQVGPLQRLMPGGRIIMIGCMTAETRVLLADGTEKEIQHITVGDVIATYDAGRITTSQVTNWIKHRSDHVYKITTTSGKIVRANKRHPFLVDRNGERTWVRLRDLKVGDYLVEAVQPKGAPDPSRQKGSAPFATSGTSPLPVELAHNEATGTGASGEGWGAQLRGAPTRSSPKGSVTAATARLLGALANTVSRRSRSAPATSSTATGSPWRTMPTWSRVKEVFARFVSAHRQKPTQGPGNNQSCTSTTATTPTACGGCCVTIATWPSGTQEHQPCCSPLPHTYEVTTAAIVEIVEDGFEPVFDIEVERTENFIANGVVSHNTRWGKKDPIGRALDWARKNTESTPWYEVRFPAVMDVVREEQTVQVSLWPEQWPLEQLLAKKAGMRPQFWAAQYMQEPTGEEGAIMKREWWRIWPHDDPPEVEFVIQTWDTAHDTKTHNDYSACLTWGVWFNEDSNRHEIILLDAWWKRVEFPDLKKKALEMAAQWRPEALVVEKKAAGAPLIQELRHMGLHVEEVSPSRGTLKISNDKRARFNAVTGIVQDGLVWAPDTRWAHEVIDLCAEFPNGEFDDPVDCVELALQRFRRGGFVTLSTDEVDNDEPALPGRAAYY